MVSRKELKEQYSHLTEKVKQIKLVLTDNDGVLTDTGVYYSEKGEKMKRFSIRDGMGVERLRKILEIETGIVTGEKSGSVKTRAEKLCIKELHLNSKDKVKVLEKILKKKKLNLENIAYMGDDVNDIEIIGKCGLTASPANAMPDVRELVDFISTENGGNGAFREFAELIIALRSET